MLRYPQEQPWTLCELTGLHSREVVVEEETNTHIVREWQVLRGKESGQGGVLTPMAPFTAG